MKRTVFIPLTTPPVSQNNRSLNKLNSYKTLIVNAFSQRYKRIFNFKTKEIYGLVYYLRLKQHGIDADNISKPLWDSLNGTYYIDDNQIKIRIAAVLTLDKYNSFNLKRIRGLRKVDQQLVIDFFTGKLPFKHMLYIHINETLTRHYKFKI